MIIDDEKLESILAAAGPLPSMETRWEPPEDPGHSGSDSITGKHEVGAGGKVLDLVGLSREFELLTLGPVYSFAHLQFSIPEQVSQDINRELHWITGVSPVRVAEGLGEWDHMIEGIRKDDWEVFKKNMLAINIVNRPAQIYWEIECTPIIVAAAFPAPVTINVFHPTGNTLSYLVSQPRDPNIVLNVTPIGPSNDVKDRAKLILETK